MAFRRVDLQEAFFAPGRQPFRVYGYGTSAPLEEVLQPAYFAAARGVLRRCVWSRISAARAICQADSPAVAATEPDASPAPVKRGRGRAPGSRTKKPKPPAG